MTATVRKFEEQTDFADIAAYETEVDALRGEVDRLKDENLELASGNLTTAAKKEDSVLELTPGIEATRVIAYGKMLKDSKRKSKSSAQRTLSSPRSSDASRGFDTVCGGYQQGKLKASAREIAEKTQQVNMWKKRYQQTEQHLHRITEDNRRCQRIRALQPRREWHG